MNEVKQTVSKNTCEHCGKKCLVNPHKTKRFIALRNPTICSECIEEASWDLEESKDKLYISEEDRAAQIYTESGISISTYKKGSNSNQPKPLTSSLPSLEEIITKVTNRVTGQKDGIIKIATTIYSNNENNLLMDENPDTPLQNNNILLVGPTGCGKTTTIGSVCDSLGLPYGTFDATEYTGAGYHGANVHAMLLQLIDKANHSARRAERGILFIDEGDKKEPKNSSDVDVSGKNVLNELLKILEGSKVNIKDSKGDDTGYIMDTSKLTVIFAGVFPELAKIREKRLTNKSIGYANSNPTDEITQYTAADFEKHGFPAEFFGRFATVVEFKQLTKDEFKEIILDNEYSIFNQNKYKLRLKHNIALIITDEAVDKLCEHAIKLGTGVRALNSKISEIMLGAMHKIYTSSPNTFKSCTITPDSIISNNVILE